METINQLIDSLTAIGMVFAVVASFVVIMTAGIQALRMRAVRWDALAFILVILWAIPIGLRHYGPQLMDASTDSIVAMSEKGPRMRDAIRNLLADVVEPWQEGEQTTVTTEPVPVDTPLPTATPTIPSSLEPTPEPTQPVVTSTPLPTATATAVPTLDLSIWNIQTPPPTPVLGQ